MPAVECARCGCGQFAIELRRLQVIAGDVTLSARAPAQVCLRCGLAVVDFKVAVEQRPAKERADGDEPR